MAYREYVRYGNAATERGGLVRLGKKIVQVENVNDVGVRKERAIIVIFRSGFINITGTLRLTSAGDHERIDQCGQPAVSTVAFCHRTSSDRPLKVVPAVALDPES